MGSVKSEPALACLDRVLELKEKDESNALGDGEQG